MLFEGTSRRVTLSFPYLILGATTVREIVKDIGDAIWDCLNRRICQLETKMTG
jgi:hypothetical protein